MENVVPLLAPQSIAEPPMPFGPEWAPPAREDVLHYLWMTQQFTHSALATVCGKTISVINPGMYNRNAGPDFLNARILIDGIDWGGQVEIHVKSSEWTAHRHHNDPAYQGVVLHVVWQNDKEAYRNDGTVVPVLELKGRVNRAILDKYNSLACDLSEAPPCLPQVGVVTPLIVESMLGRALTERLMQKAEVALGIAEELDFDWEEVAFRMLMRGMGGQINPENFYNLAKSISGKYLRKMADDPLRMEALLFGQAGFLAGQTDEYATRLHKQFEFDKNRLNLLEPVLNWKFGRMRPANFPTLRLAQVAAIMGVAPGLFSAFIDAGNTKAILTLLRTPSSAYWQKRYNFGVEGKTGAPAAGADFAQSLLINAVVPVLVAYGKARGQHSLIENAFKLLEDLPAEKNRITNLFPANIFINNNAGQSQGIIGLYKNYCLLRKCAYCQIGSGILRFSGQ